MLLLLLLLSLWLPPLVNKEPLPLPPQGSIKHRHYGLGVEGGGRVEGEAGVQQVAVAPRRSGETERVVKVLRRVDTVQR